MGKNLKVLILEDLPTDAELAKRELKTVLKNYKVKVVDTEKGFVQALDTFKPDLIISDYKLPSFDGLSALKICGDKSPITPFVILTGSQNEDTAVKCLKAGADDYVIKEHIKRLGPAILNAMEKKKNEIEYMQAEAALHRSEERFRQITENSQEWIWEVDSNGLYTYSSKMVEVMFDYKQEEIVGKKHFYDLFVQEDREELKNAAFNVFRQKQPFREFINRNLTKKAEIIWLSTRGIPILDEDGNLLGYRGSNINITEKKLSEDKLIKNQYYLSKAQELGLIGTWELDIQKNILIWTEENYRIFGVPMGTEMNYDIFLNCVHPDDRDYVNEKWNAGLNKEPYDIEHRLIVNDKIKWVREKADIEFDKKGNPTIAIGFTQDITERKKTEAALKSSEERLKVIFESAPDAIYLCDFKGNFIDGNKASEDLLGYKKEELIGKSFLKLKLLSGKELPIAVKALAKNVLGKSTGPDEFLLNRKDGSQIQVEIVTHPVKIKEKTVILGIARDISERKKSEQELSKEKTLLKTIIDNIPVLITRYDPDSNMLFLNKEFEKIVGWETEEVKDINMMEKVYPDPDYRKKAMEYMQKASKDWREFRVQSKSGKIINSEWSNIRLEDGTQIGIGIDITERKRSEEKIARFGRIFEDSLNEIYLFETDTLKFTQVNNAAQHNIGYTMEELKEMTLLDIKPEFTAESFAELVEPLQKDIKKEIVFETVHKRKDKSFYNVEVHLQILKYEKGAFYVAIILDITERKKAEDEILKLKDGLEVQVAEKTKELNEKISDLERFFDATIDREFKMKELRDRIDELETELKKYKNGREK